ncbi:flavo protein [Hesseltinella vesiculosa]|uniref:Flavo protein n=1 Tax=Hesseltinella vesiculosa TaxID=101127 RepID=A0A1X2GBN0_9FUNG|nr:flavo protein [Hesseltinella vesiculosa]
MTERSWNVLLGCTGSVASIKVPLIVEELKKKIPGVNVKVVPTNASYFFFKDMAIDAPVHTDEEEWALWKKKTDPVLHIELRKWADVFVIAPLDANTLAKMANGICDNLLTCVLRAWDLDNLILLAPAMNTNMWHHPFTRKHINEVNAIYKMSVIAPTSKLLACGDVGVGAMAEPKEIAEEVFQALQYIASNKE